MLLGFSVLAILAAPFTPRPVTPVGDAWNSNTVYFEVSPYGDDAGVLQSALQVLYRRDDAGYTDAGETRGATDHFSAAGGFLPDGSRWCWRAAYVNAAGARSPYGPEACFRMDSTPPSGATCVDGGPALGSGAVTVSFTPATDATSGVRGYALITGPTPAGPWFDYVSPVAGPPLSDYFGQGTWYAWVLSYDRAFNDDHNSFSGEVVRFEVVANAAIGPPPSPTWESAAANAYGDSLWYDEGWAADAGIAQVVASFCDVDAGCQWRLGFHARPVDLGYPSEWQQVGDEGFYVARVAGVRGGEVGPWSPPSGVLAIDRSEPTVPQGLAATPLASRAGPVQLTWSASSDPYSPTVRYAVEEQDLAATTRRQLPAPGPALTVSPGHDGRFQYRAKAIDQVGLESLWSADSAVVVLDSTGPSSTAPAASAQAVDGGARVQLTWAQPVDALSAVTLEELEEVEASAGATVFAVTGTSVARALSPGSYQWRLRGTDALGNVGAFGAASNTVGVSTEGVVVVEPDGGGAGEPDAGTREDPRQLRVGCGCGQGAGEALGAALLFVACALGRRRAPLLRSGDGGAQQAGGEGMATRRLGRRESTAPRFSEVHCPNSFEM